MKITSRKLFLVAALTLSISSCSAGPAPQSDFIETPSASATASAPPVHDQDTDEADGHYHDNNEYVPASKYDEDGNSKPMSADSELIAENLNWFFQKVTYEWTDSPSRAFPDDAPTRKVFPESAEFLSKDIPEYQAKRLTSAVTNTVEEWSDVRFMVDGYEVEFTEDGKFARIEVDGIVMEASPNMGLYNSLSGKQESGDGYIILNKEDDDWKVSGIGGRFAANECLISCGR